MADTNNQFKIEGVRLEDLEPISVLSDETILLVGINKVCRIVSLKSLRQSFAGDPTSPDKDSVYYNATYIDNKFETVESNLSEMKQNITNLTNEVSQSIQNLNSKFDTLSSNLTDKINTQINDAVKSLNDKINNNITSTDEKIENLNTTINNKIAEINNTMKTVVTKSKKISTSLPASGWVGDDKNPPFSITISVSGVTTTNNVEVLLPGTASLEQVEAWCNAGIVHGTQTDGSITLKGYNSKPEINIPIEVIIRTDI